MKQSLILLAAFIILLAFQSAVTITEPVTKAQLGKLLFFDPILSRDTTISCSSCHKPVYAFADTMPVSTGVQRKKGVRNTPTVMNMLLRQPLFWDGRSKTLEEQALLPIENNIEMNLPVDEAVRRLTESPIY